MKHNKPDARQLAEIENRALEIGKLSGTEVVKYLEAVELEAVPEIYKHVYNYIRNAMVTELGEKGLKRPTFAAIIERIARTAVQLQAIESDSWGDMQELSKSKDYMKLQKEHRDCVELFANLKFAEENKRKKKVLEELRRQVSLEE